MVLLLFITCSKRVWHLVSMDHRGQVAAERHNHLRYHVTMVAYTKESIHTTANTQRHLEYINNPRCPL